MARLISLHGDPYLCRGHYTELIAELGTAEITRVSQGDGPERAVEEGMMLAFMEPHRVIRIDGAMTPEQGGRRASSKKGNRWAESVAEMAGMPETTVYIWMDEAVPKSDPTLKEITKFGEVRALDKPKGQALRHWIKDEVKQRGGRAGDDACAALVERCEDDLWQLSHECEKLALYCGDTTATATDVGNLVDENAAASVFGVVDGLFQGQPAKAARIAETLMDRGQSPFYVLSMMQREARLMATTARMDANSASSTEVMEALGTRSEFVLRKSREHARQVGEQGMAQWYDILVQADHAIKTGALEDNQAVYWAIGALSGVGKRD